MTPEELIRKRKRDELLKRANAAQPTTPTDGEQLVSENTKETLKAAGHWAGVIGKRAAELTQKGSAPLAVITSMSFFSIELVSMWSIVAQLI